MTVKKYTIELDLEFDSETVGPGGFKLADPEDWNWQGIINHPLDRAIIFVTDACTIDREEV